MMKKSPSMAKQAIEDIREARRILKAAQGPVNNIEFLQSVIITLSDGTEHAYHGMTAIDPKDPKTAKLKVTGVAFTVPEKMPEGMKWGRIG